VNLRRDHFAGGAFVAVGVVVLAVSRDLPFGTLASPGAGLLPTLVIGLMMGFGALLLIGAGDSPYLSGVAWDDLPHAVRVVAVAAAAIALYETLGFIVTVALLLFSLIFLVERRPILVAVAVSAVVSIATYLLFNTLLKAPLPRGLFGF
jgi:hypothetical protein